MKYNGKKENHKFDSPGEACERTFFLFLFFFTVRFFLGTGSGQKSRKNIQEYPLVTCISAEGIFIFSFGRRQNIKDSKLPVGAQALENSRSGPGGESRMSPKAL